MTNPSADGQLRTDSDPLQLDRADPLAPFRDEFHIPRTDDGREQVYFAGNSLGLQPKQTANFVLDELDRWSKFAVRGHFLGPYPWMPYHEFLAEPMARIVGANPDEVVVMNSLTVNLHLMLATFYRPTGSRTKILIEGQAFPSDHFAVESQIRWHGRDPRQELVIASPRAGRDWMSMDEWCETIERHRNELAVVLLPGVQYFTGQVFEIERLTRFAQQYGIIVGFDLAHAAGNIELKLHNWNVDFAVWCTYKYLNSGPGSVGGSYLHERHARDTTKLRLAGWWGHNKNTRFAMKTEFDAMPTAEGWQVSNPPILSLAAIRASLDVFERAGGIPALRAKSLQLTRYLADQLRRQVGDAVQIITPEPYGCQLSLRSISARLPGRHLKGLLDEAGFETDWREPNVIRVAPVPLYNRFAEVHAFVAKLALILAQ